MSTIDQSIVDEARKGELDRLNETIRRLREYCGIPDGKCTLLWLAERAAIVRPNSSAVSNEVRLARAQLLELKDTLDTLSNIT